MILLEPGNRILEEIVSDKIRADPAAKREALDVRLCDFDDVSYRVSTEGDKKNILVVSIAIPFWAEVKDFGGQEALDLYYKGLAAAEPQAGYHITLNIDLDNLPMPAEELIKRLALMKSNLIGGVFYRPLNNLLKGTAPEAPFKFSFRQDTQVYFFPAADRVIVIFSLDFVERVDLAVAKVFLQEFVDTRRHMGSAPPCGFSLNPPMEMKQFNITEPQGKLGFLSFTIFKTHLDNNKLEKVVGTLQLFRTYLQYHIKCSKAHFHARMRARVRSLLKVLNRAKQDQDDNAPKKTITGKTFVRK